MRQEELRRELTEFSCIQRVERLVELADVASEAEPHFTVRTVFLKARAATGLFLAFRVVPEIVL